MSKNISAGKVKIASLEWLDVMNFRLTEKVNEPLEIKVELQEFTSKFSDLVGKLINFEFSQENILASWEEEQKLKSDLIENLLSQLFRKLNFLLN